MAEKVGRNDPCSCGSGKKYKKCCEAKHKYKSFEAKVISGSGRFTNLFSQVQASSNLFNREVKPITPTVAGEPQKEQDPTVGHESERQIDL
jgi:hypothetical protein